MAIHCENVRCRHYQEEGCGNPDVIIGKDGKCRSFEKGISHYFLLVWVTSRVKLTKAQREFLYDYFLSMGDRFKAEQYI